MTTKLTKRLSGGRFAGYLLKDSPRARLIDAIKDDSIDDDSAPAYVTVLSEAYEEKRPVRWE